MTVAYLAHPIDQTGAAKPGVEERAARQRCQQEGWAVYDPARAWRLDAGLDDGSRLAIAEVNRAALDACDRLVAVLPDRTPTLGVPVEVERALADKKPTEIWVGMEVGASVQVDTWRRAGAKIRTATKGDGRSERPDGADEFRKGHERPTRGLSVVIEGQGGRLPSRGYPGDAGWDLYASEAVALRPGQYVEVATDVRIGLPAGHWGLLVGRSSTARRGLLVNQAVIDQGYTGPMFFGVTNVSGQEQRVDAGERLAQLIPLPLAELGLRQVDSLPETERSTRGFGSTGA